MSINTGWHPSILLPPSERPETVLPTPLFLDLYRPRLRQILDDGSIHDDDLFTHMIRATVSAYEMLIHGKQGKSDFLLLLTAETDWDNVRRQGYYDIDDPELAPLIERRHYNRVSETDQNILTQLEGYLRIFCDTQIETIINNDAAGESEEEYLFGSELWDFICRYADATDMRRTADFMAWAENA